MLLIFFLFFILFDEFLNLISAFEFILIDDSFVQHGLLSISLDESSYYIYKTV